MNEGDPLYSPLQAKTPLIDIQAPILSSGYPTLRVNKATGNAVMSLMVNDTPNPEVVTAQVQYGPDTNYGSVATYFHGRWASSRGDWSVQSQPNCVFALGVRNRLSLPNYLDRPGGKHHDYWRLHKQSLCVDDDPGEWINGVGNYRG